MTFLWKITYHPLDVYGIEYLSSVRVHRIHAHTAEEAYQKACKKYGEEAIISVEGREADCYE